MDNKTIFIGIVFVLTLFLLNVIGDNFTGEAKGGIKGAPEGKGKSVFQCNDGLDNDRDGYCDFLWKKASCSDGSILGDPGCTSKDDNDESSDCVPACTSNGECGNNGYVADPFCGSDGNVYKNFQAFTCENAGKCSSVCNEQINSLIWDTCGSNSTCSNGTCASLGFCGNGICSVNENCSICESDCGTCPVVCGNSICEMGEDVNNCLADCPVVCGDGTCSETESCSSCPPDCGTCQGSNSYIFQSIGDVNVIESLPNNNYGNYHSFSVVKRFTGDYMAFVNFNLSSIPQNEVVQSAILDLKTGTPGIIENVSVATYGINEPWNEYVVTWSNQPNTDIVSTDSVYVTSSLVHYTWNVTSLIQEQHLFGNNYGVALKALEEGHWPFSSKECLIQGWCGSSDDFPRLIVTTTSS